MEMFSDWEPQVISYAAMIRAANLDNLEPRMVTVGRFTWDKNKCDCWVAADGLSAKVWIKR
jgi:hypothetical protein